MEFQEGIGLGRDILVVGEISVAVIISAEVGSYPEILSPQCELAKNTRGTMIAAAIINTNKRKNKAFRRDDASASSISIRSGISSSGCLLALAMIDSAVKLFRSVLMLRRNNRLSICPLLSLIQSLLLMFQIPQSLPLGNRFISKHCKSFKLTMGILYESRNTFNFPHRLAWSSQALMSLRCLPQPGQLVSIVTSSTDYLCPLYTVLFLWLSCSGISSVQGKRGAGNLLPWVWGLS